MTTNIVCIVQHDTSLGHMLSLHLRYPLTSCTNYMSAFLHIFVGKFRQMVPVIFFYIFADRLSINICHLKCLISCGFPVIHKHSEYASFFVQQASMTILATCPLTMRVI